MAGRIVYAICGKCHQEDIEAQKIPSEFLTYQLLNNNDGIVQFKCRRGHNCCIIIQELKFETLVNIAVENILDKYYREAIFNFAAAQERCFEFVIELLCLEQELSKDEYLKIWKFFENQSERQLGAFCSLYFSRFKANPFNYNEFANKANIRNRVVHKGQIPSKDDVYKYGNYMLENIYNIMKNVTEKVAPKLLNDFVSQKNREKFEKAQEQDVTISLISSSIISWRTATLEDLEQEQKLREYSAKNERKYAEMAVQANAQHQILFVDEKGHLVLKDSQEPFVKKTTAEYIGKTNLNELVKHVSIMRSIQMRGSILLED